jgi:hypothetical protein
MGYDVQTALWRHCHIVKTFTDHDYGLNDPIRAYTTYPMIPKIREIDGSLGPYGDAPGVHQPRLGGGSTITTVGKGTVPRDMGDGAIGVDAVNPFDGIRIAPDKIKRTIWAQCKVLNESRTDPYRKQWK